eukprot:jgi/Botrbrau1/22353/Bobra.0002s0031.1
MLATLKTLLPTSCRAVVRPTFLIHRSGKKHTPDKLLSTDHSRMYRDLAKRAHRRALKRDLTGWFVQLQEPYKADEEDNDDSPAKGNKGWRGTRQNVHSHAKAPLRDERYAQGSGRRNQRDCSGDPTAGGHSRRNPRFSGEMRRLFNRIFRSQAYNAERLAWDQESPRGYKGYPGRDPGYPQGDQGTPRGDWVDHSARAPKKPQPSKHSSPQEAKQRESLNRQSASEGNRKSRVTYSSSRRPKRSSPEWDGEWTRSDELWNSRLRDRVYGNDWRGEKETTSGKSRRPKRPSPDWDGELPRSDVRWNSRRGSRVYVNHWWGEETTSGESQPDSEEEEEEVEEMDCEWGAQMDEFPGTSQRESSPWWAPFRKRWRRRETLYADLVMDYISMSGRRSSFRVKMDDDFFAEQEAQKRRARYQASWTRAEARVDSHGAGLEEHYDNLGLGRGEALTLARVQEAFRSTALRWHPDRHAGDGKEAAEARFKAATASYETLLARLKR